LGNLKQVTNPFHPSPTFGTKDLSKHQYLSGFGEKGKKKPLKIWVIRDKYDAIGDYSRAIAELIGLLKLAE
jgi:hypothetical protein